MKKTTTILIGLIIFAAAFIVFAAWAKITHMLYADNMLTVAVALQIASIFAAIVFYFRSLKKAK